MFEKKRTPKLGCLDDSPYGYYIRLAEGARNDKKWIINLEGGGECIGKSDCTQRTHSSLGSSKLWRSLRGPDIIQSYKQDVNPDFYDFNQIFLPYCSGDLFLGQDESVNDRAYGMRFSGYNNILGTIDHLIHTYGLHLSDAIIYTGASAGGIGAVATIEDVKTYIAQASSQHHYPVPVIVGAPIAGFYFNNDKPYTDPSPAPISYIKWSYEDLKEYATFWNAKLNAECSKYGNPWECMFAARQYSTMTTPMFFTHAQTDSTVMPLHDGLPSIWGSNPPQCDKPSSYCPANVKKYIQTWAKDMFTAQQQVLDGVLLHGRKDGLFSAACLTHTGFNHLKPIVDNLTFLDALAKWFNGGNPISSSSNLHVDDCMDNGNGSPACGICGGY